MKEVKIHLNEFKTAGSKVFTGRKKGLEVRRLSKIDELEIDNEKITIVIPNDIYSINPSFLEELLVNVVTKLGKEGFYTKFSVQNDGEYKIAEDLEEAIERILRTENALV